MAVLRSEIFEEGVSKLHGICTWRGLHVSIEEIDGLFSFFHEALNDLFWDFEFSILCFSEQLFVFVLSLLCFLSEELIMFKSVLQFGIIEFDHDSRQKYNTITITLSFYGKFLPQTLNLLKIIVLVYFFHQRLLFYLIEGRLGRF